MKTEAERAYDQGAADCENDAFNSPRRCREKWQDYDQGWSDCAEYLSEASLRYAESGAAYENYLDSMSPISEREEEEMRALEDLYHEFDHTPYNPEDDYERDPFIARVLAYGEEAQRESDRLWKAGEPERKAKAAAARKRWQDEIPF